MAGNAAKPGVSVTSRVLALFAAFDERHRALTLTALADRAGLSLPTTHRLVAELVDWGALTRRDNGEFVLGRRMWDLGLLAPVQSGLRQLASPILHDLYAATHATVHLAERDGRRVLYLDRVSGQASTPVISRVGTRLPLHTTGVGKVLLAHAPAEVQRDVLAHLSAPTPHSITQPTRLRAQLCRVRAEGYAQTSEEMTLGACSLAVPLTDTRGRVIAALGLVVATLKGNRARLLAALRVAAQGIDRSIAAHSAQ